MSLDSQILFRVIGDDPELEKGIRSGLYRPCGGVIRVAKGHKNAGSIVAHLKFPDDAQQATESLARLQQVLGGQAGGLQESIDLLQNLQAANLALSGLNLAVSVAGFAIVCHKLNGISTTLATHSAKLDQLLGLALEARRREEFRDAARFRATIDTARQFAEMGEVDQLKSLLKDFREQYEFTRALLVEAARNAASNSFLESREYLGSLQQRLMYLAHFQSFVQQRIDAPQYAVAALRKLQEDWLEINQAIVQSIVSNRDWTGQLSIDCAEKIVSFLEYRKTVAPAIEYQASLLEFACGRPQLRKPLANDSNEILLLAA